MILAPAMVLHRLVRLQRQLETAKKKGLWLEGGPRPAAPDFGPALFDPDDVRPSRPQNFYLPDPSYEALADCFALVGGARLPLHGQMLAARAAVLRDLFVAQAADELEESGGVSSRPASRGEPSELSAAFGGCGVREVAVFLRLIYSPDQATPGTLRAVHKSGNGRLLAAVAGLAHRLNAAGLLAQIESYLQVASTTASIPELISTVQLAEACHLSCLNDACLDLLARQLAAAGPFWREQVSERQLAECNSESLASLACKMAGRVHAGGSAGAFEPPAVHGVQRGLRGAAGGFTWVIQHFSKQQGRITSPWVEVGGIEWRLKVWPKGDDAAGGTHVSAYLECNYAQALSAGLPSVEAFYDFTFLDQGEEGLHFNVDCGKDVFTATTQNWGKTRMMPLSELARQDRRYLEEDRLAVRIAIRVMPRAGSDPTAAAAAAVPEPVAPPPAAPA